MREINVGDKFNNLTLVQMPYTYHNAARTYTRRHGVFQCVCGNQIDACIHSVLKGHTKSCGCMMHILKAMTNKESGKRRYSSIKIGDVFGRLTVTGNPVLEVTPSGKNEWAIPCLCVCGRFCYPLALNLLKHTTSCGCLKADLIGKRSLKHGLSYDENARLLYHTWHNIKSRCACPSNKSFYRYGGRGITMAEEWAKDFAVFYKWSLENGYLSGLQIDRRNNDGPYSPENCRWVTPLINAQNKSNNRIVVAFGETKCLSEWLRDARCRVNYSGVVKRLSAGWTPENAITKPPQPGQKL